MKYCTPSQIGIFKGGNWEETENPRGRAGQCTKALSQHFRTYCKACIDEWEEPTFAVMLLNLYVNGGLLCLFPHSSGCLFRATLSTTFDFCYFFLSYCNSPGLAPHTV